MNTVPIPDTSREWITVHKLLHLIHIFLVPSSTKCFASVKYFHDIEFTKLKQAWYSWIILDIDDTIAPHHGEILQENIEIIKSLIWQGWSIVIFSNMKKTQRYHELENMRIQVVTSPFAKPDPRGFQDALKALQKEKKQTVVIWDNFLTDGGSMNSGISFIKVSPIRSDKKRGLSRKIQIAIQNVIDNIAHKRWHI